MKTLSDRSVMMKASLFDTLCRTNDKDRIFLLAAILAILYEAAPQRTKDLVDDKIETYGRGVKHG